MNRPQERQDSHTAIRVLHLDDESDYLALVAEFLQRAGSFDVVSETDTEVALERIRSEEVDCVVSDFDMPEMDGLALLAEVRDTDPKLPFILFTGKGSEEIAAEAISAGVTDYVQKGGGRERYEVLAHRIENAVERARAAARSRETSNRLQETFDRITDSFLSLDSDWRITYVNDQGASFLGGSPADLLGRDLRTLPPNGAARFHAEYAEAMRTQEPVSFETESLTQSGRWLDIRAYPAEDGLSIYWRDITTVRRRERLLADLHRGARGLLSCDTPERIGTHAVTLVESVLGFTAASLFRLDDGEGVHTFSTSPSAEATEEIADETSGGIRALSELFETQHSPIVIEDETDVPSNVASTALTGITPGVYVAVGDQQVLVARESHGEFDEFDVYCLQLLATTLETALSRTHRERELETNRNVIRALHGSVMEFQACEEVDAVLDVAIRCARDVVSFDRCLFARHHDGALERVAQSDDLPGTESGLSTEIGVSGRVYRTGESVVVDDTQHSDEVHQPCPFRSLLTVPLGDWGIFQAVAEEPNAFDAADRELAELLAMHVRAALSQVESDQLLRRERDLLAAFFESSGEPMVRVRFEGDRACIDRVNPVFERVFGVDAAAVHGDSLDEHITPVGKSEAALAFDEQSNAGEPVEAEICRYTEDGPREFLFRSVPFRGDDDVPMAYGIYADITARKRHERTLERYRTIIESTGDPVYTLDAEGVITYVNEAFGSMTGYDPEALVGEHMGLLVTETDVERSEQLIRELLRDDGGTNDTLELDLVCADGTHVRCENHIALLPFDHEFEGTAGLIRDITARNARKRELKAQNERLDEFASVVSHDLRNPLQVAQGNLQLARETLGTDDESLERVKGALDRIDAIVDDVLTLAREGEDASDVTDASVADIARLAWKSVDTPNGRLTIQTDLTVRADKERLQRLFENLFRNAVEHGSDGPPAADSTLSVRVGHVDDEESVAFFVEDDGPGVDPDERDRVFETGYSTSDEGTGFGLDIVRRIANSHEWGVTLSDSELGGARFEFHVAE